MIIKSKNPNLYLPVAQMMVDKLALENLDISIFPLTMSLEMFLKYDTAYVSVTEIPHMIEARHSSVMDDASFN
jgi:hypothetical protein